MPTYCIARLLATIGYRQTRIRHSSKALTEYLYYALMDRQSGAYQLTCFCWTGHGIACFAPPARKRAVRSLGNEHLITEQFHIVLFGHCTYMAIGELQLARRYVRTLPSRRQNEHQMSIVKGLCLEIFDIVPGRFSAEQRTPEG